MRLITSLTFAFILGSLTGTIYMDNGSASGQKLGEWVGFAGRVR